MKKNKKIKLYWFIWIQDWNYTFLNDTKKYHREIHTHWLIFIRTVLLHNTYSTWARTVFLTWWHWHASPDEARCIRVSHQEKAADTEVPTPRNLASTLHWLPEKRKESDAETKEATFFFPPPKMRCAEASAQSGTTPRVFTFLEKVVLGWKICLRVNHLYLQLLNQETVMSEVRGQDNVAPNKVLMKEQS